jgi:hypothetical protein
VPISKFQSDVLKVIAAARSPDSYVAGAVPINRRRGPRTSKDIDIFHAREEDAAAAAENDARLLREAGFTIRWLRRLPGIYSAEIVGPEGSTRLEWVADADYRFFPATADELFGYVLHPVDLAVNKLIAAANRREPRDIVDLVTVHESYLPLGALALAAAGITGGFTPEGLLEEVSRNSRYARDDFRGLSSEVPIDPDAVSRTLRAALEEAREFVARMPTEEVGTIFLKEGMPVEPDPNDLSAYVRHKPQRKGHWPSAPEITSSMLERLQTSAEG